MTVLINGQFSFIGCLPILLLIWGCLNGCASSKLDKDVTLQFGDINKTNVVRKTKSFENTYHAFL